MRAPCSLLTSAIFHRRLKPGEDTDKRDVELEIAAVEVMPEWTQVSFKRDLTNLDAEQVLCLIFFA